MRHPKRHHVFSTCMGLVAAVAMVSATPLTALAASQQNNRQEIFNKAAKEFNVPENVLLAVSYNESRWENHDGQASINGGYGLMNLTTASIQTDSDERGDPNRPLLPKPDTKKDSTLDEASSLLHVSTDQLKKDDTQNVRGAAAVIAKYAKDLHDGQLPKSDSDWYGAVAKYSGANDSQTAKDFADQVYGTMRDGASSKTTDGQSLDLQKDNDIQPKTNDLKKLSLQAPATQANGTDCPSDIMCRFVPAGYAANSSDPADYGNYDHANRPSDKGSVDAVLIATTHHRYVIRSVSYTHLTLPTNREV